MPATPFPNSVVHAAWIRSGGKCECMDGPTCAHPVMPHGRFLDWDSRGDDYSPGGWELHHRDPKGLAVLTNAQVLCIECHSRTDSYGTGKVAAAAALGTCGR